MQLRILKKKLFNLKVTSVQFVLNILLTLDASEILLMFTCPTILII